VRTKSDVTGIINEPTKPKDASDKALMTTKLMYQSC